ncbi:hypothetical protein DV517_66370 [Streptomyces sp. S816]|uniref:hypothetical protein n=1 Tax=Streptomyces sp. S816 TaxID=2283197 RepID=UPI001133B399|nr:hypothetical protein [Streptomyces sp. S816]TGZ12553.1 hypothetical protein DV517_66370 [Streptomyces sp. S816]
MAIEDGWVLGEHVARHRAEDGKPERDATLRGRPPGTLLWHLDGVARRLVTRVLGP